MDLTAMVNLNTRKTETRPAAKQTTATARTLLRYLPDSLHLNDCLASRDFTLCEVTIGKLAVVERRDGFDLQANAERTTAPVIVDINKRRVGKTTTGFVPNVIVIEGASRLALARKSGATAILAWVGSEAVAALGKYAVPVQRRSMPVSPVAKGGTQESAVFISANAGGGMGSPGTAGLGSTSLQYGSNAMDKLGMRACIGKRPGGLPKNPADNLNAGIKVPKNPADDLSSAFANPIGNSRPMTSAPTGAMPGMNKTVPHPSPGSGVGPHVVSPNAGRPIMPPRLDAESVRIKKIVTKYKRALKAGTACPPSDDMMASAPPGMESNVRSMKKHFKKGSSAPFAIAWWQHNKQKGNDMAGCATTEALQYADKMMADMHMPDPGFSNPGDQR